MARTGKHRNPFTICMYTIHFEQFRLLVSVAFVLRKKRDYAAMLHKQIQGTVIHAVFPSAQISRTTEDRPPELSFFSADLG